MEKKYVIIFYKDQWYGGKTSCLEEIERRYVVGAQMAVEMASLNLKPNIFIQIREVIS